MSKVSDIEFTLIHSDLDEFVQMYERFGIDVDVNATDSGYEIKIGMNAGYGDNVTESDKFEGYTGFYSIIAFDDKGSFVNQGFYE